MFASPRDLVRELHLRENMIVADLGAGTGFLSVEAARLVPEGKVYAVEIIKDYLTTIKEKTKAEGLNNIEVIWGDIEKPGGTKIASEMADRVIASSVLFQVEEKEKFIEEIKRILKPEGLALLVEWEIGLHGAKHKSFVPKASARAMFEGAGLKFEREVMAGKSHYGMIFKKG